MDYFSSVSPISFVDNLGFKQLPSKTFYCDDCVYRVNNKCSKRNLDVKLINFYNGCIHYESGIKKDNKFNKLLHQEIERRR